MLSIDEVKRAFTPIGCTPAVQVVMTSHRGVIVGGGPAGLYTALELRLTAGWTDVEVYADESDGGVGIVVERSFVDALSRRDPISGARIVEACREWDTVRSCVDGVHMRTGGHVICGISRSALVSILAERVQELGVEIHRRRAGDDILNTSADLLVGADGAGSAVRAHRRSAYATRVAPGRNHYLWMRTNVALPAGFWFRRTDAGTFIAHTYPYPDPVRGRDAGAVVVEASPNTVAAAGLRDLGRVETERRLATVFQEELEGARIEAVSFPWQPFRTVHNERWFDGRHVLVGDAAHTVHFSVGSGTRLAIEDAIALAARMADAGADLSSFLAAYQAERQAVVSALLSEAAESQAWFEDVDRHVQLPPSQLAFSLRSRRQVNTYGWLRRRDPELVRHCVAAVRERRPGTGSHDDPGPSVPALDIEEPRRLPLPLGSTVLANRIAAIATGGTVDGVEPAVRLRGPVAGTATRRLVGSVVTRPGSPPSAGCELLTGPWPTLRGLLEQPGRPGVVRGAMVDPAAMSPSELGWCIAVTDFVVVAEDVGGRVRRTRTAEELRNRYGSTVFLTAPELPADELNTLILAGRIDGCLVAPADRAFTRPDAGGDR